MLKVSPYCDSNRVTNADEDQGELVLHCAILCCPSREEKLDNYLALIKHIVSVVPGVLEQKSSEGWTPLQVAVLTHQPEVVAYLLSEGANQRHRDKAGRNVLHSMVASHRNGSSKNDAKKLQSLIELFDKAAIKEMLVERCNERPGALTPLALWMAKNYGNYKKTDIVSILNKYADGGEHLSMINGEGDLPLHVVCSLALRSGREATVNLE